MSDSAVRVFSAKGAVSFGSLGASTQGTKIAVQSSAESAFQSRSHLELAAVNRAFSPESFRGCPRLLVKGNSLNYPLNPCHPWLNLGRFNASTLLFQRIFKHLLLEGAEKPRITRMTRMV
jgi:hypothetical protein